MGKYIAGIAVPVVLGFGMLLSAIIFLVIGVGFSAGTSIVSATCTEPVTATVTDYEYNSDNIPTPVLEYEYGDETYIATTDVYASDFVTKYPVDSTLEIKVNPENPTEIYSDDLTAALGAVGIGFIIAGVIGFILSAVALVVMIVNIVGLVKYKKSRKQNIDVPNAV